MGRLLLLLMSTLLASQSPAVHGLFEWLRQAVDSPAPPPPPETLPPPAAQAPTSLASNAQFEMMTADEKFLAEAKQLELSPLDSCHYRVVAQLKSSCEKLSEEKLAKLGVVLFNCQAEIEGRPTYPCTEEMTIKECTADMDADTWNAYHIVSNRARSVCYATRQQLFRRRAEHTVNQLISTAANQLHAMNDLKEGQSELKELTAASLDKLLEGHGALQAQQGRLRQGQEHLEGSLRDNLQRLTEEKALIASGQELVAELIQGITNKMENVSERLQVQGSEVQDSYKEIVDDLAEVRHQAQDIYQKIDLSLVEFLQYQDQTSHYYADLMDKLERMNGTLGVMLHYIDGMQRRIEERLHMIQDYLGWAGLSLTAMWTCLSHCGYLVLCAVLLTFLGCPAFSRVALLLMVPLNAACEINQQPALDLGGLSLLLLALSLGHWCFGRLWSCFQEGGKTLTPLPLPPYDVVEPIPTGTSYPPSSTPQKGEKDEDMEHLLNPDSFLSGDLGVSVLTPSDVKEHPRFTSITRTPKYTSPRFMPPPDDSEPLIADVPTRNLGIFMNGLDDSHSASPTPSIVSNSSLSGRQLCDGITKQGKACKRRALPGQSYCRSHEGGLSSYIQP